MPVSAAATLQVIVAGMGATVYAGLVDPGCQQRHEAPMACSADVHANHVGASSRCWHPGLTKPSTPELELKTPRTCCLLYIWRMALHTSKPLMSGSEQSSSTRSGGMPPLLGPTT